MKVSEMIMIYREQLTGIYEVGELSQVIFLVFEEVKKFSKIDLHIKQDELLTEEEIKKLNDILAELKKNKPVQYALGYAWFSGMKLKVNEHVLIPRQETEELVEWISEENRMEENALNIFDICTGSGCIAIALKKKFSAANISGIDISEDALSIAKENAMVNQTEINFIHGDILRTPNSQLPTTNVPLRNLNSELQTPNSELLFPNSQLLTLIVSNPPYVTESEKNLMEKRVLNHEPHLALFVKDKDPLVFYNAITNFALSQLKPGGKLYFEINESKGNDVKELLEKNGFKEVVVKKDLNGKDRMIRAVK